MHTGGDDDHGSKRIWELPDRRKDGPSFDSGAQDLIGAGLRAMYSELKDQPLPKRLVELIAELDGKRTDKPHEG